MDVKILEELAPWAGKVPPTKEGVEGKVSFLYRGTVSFRPWGYEALRVLHFLVIVPESGTPYAVEWDDSLTPVVEAFIASGVVAPMAPSYRISLDDVVGWRRAWGSDWIPTSREGVLPITALPQHVADALDRDGGWTDIRVVGNEVRATQDYRSGGSCGRSQEMVFATLKTTSEGVRFKTTVHSVAYEDSLGRKRGTFT